jgi:hypothetical protein
MAVRPVSPPSTKWTTVQIEVMIVPSTPQPEALPNMPDYAMQDLAAHPEEIGIEQLPNEQNRPRQVARNAPADDKEQDE